jgi:hypothetical protein
MPTINTLKPLECSATTCGACKAIASLADHPLTRGHECIKSVDDIDQGQGTVLVPPVADHVPTTITCLANPISLKLEHPFDPGSADFPAVYKSAPRF